MKKKTENKKTMLDWCGEQIHVEWGFFFFFQESQVNILISFKWSYLWHGVVARMIYFFNMHNCIH